MGSSRDNHATSGSASRPAAKPYGQVVITLKNQLLPDEKLSPTPSQNDGLDIETETDLRIHGCELIQTAGILLKLPQVAMATGQVLLQRFYYSKSLVRHPVEHTAMACVCLASKIEEAPRRVRDVINVFTHIRQVTSHKLIQPVILDVNYIQLKNLVIKAERRVLKELGFCVHIKHPHKIIVMYLQQLGYEKNQRLMQESWNYMNDSLRTDVFVRYQPETVACACIYLTARKLRLPLPKNPPWYKIFGADEKEVNDIAVRILRLYVRPKPNIDILEKKVEELCKKYQDARVKARGGGSGGGSGGGQSGGNDTPNNDSSSPNSAQKTAGAHNAWGGFISRSGSHIAPAVPEKRSRSRSPSSHSPPPPGGSSLTTNVTSSTTKNNNGSHSNNSSTSNKRSKKHHRRSSRSRSPTLPPPASRNHHHHRHHHHGSSSSGSASNNKKSSSSSGNQGTGQNKRSRSSYSRSRSRSRSPGDSALLPPPASHGTSSSKTSRRNRDKRRSPSDDRDRESSKNDRYIDRYDNKNDNNSRYDKDSKYVTKDDRGLDKDSKYDSSSSRGDDVITSSSGSRKERDGSKKYERERDRDDKYSSSSSYREKEDGGKYRDKEDKYNREDKYHKDDKYVSTTSGSSSSRKSSKHDKDRERSKDRRR